MLWIHYSQCAKTIWSRLWDCHISFYWTKFQCTVWCIYHLQSFTRLKKLVKYFFIAGVIARNAFKIIQSLSHLGTLKITCEITAQCAGKNNAYSLCYIFTVFFRKFQARMQEKLQENVKNTAHVHEIYSKIL